MNQTQTPVERLDTILKVYAGHVYLKTGIEKSKTIALDQIRNIFREVCESVIGEDEDQVFHENEMEYGINDAKLDSRNEIRQSQRQKLENILK